MALNYKISPDTGLGKKECLGIIDFVLGFDNSIDIVHDRSGNTHHREIEYGKQEYITGKFSFPYPVHNDPPVIAIIQRTTSYIPQLR